MLYFQGLETYGADAVASIPHVHPLTKISLSELQRGNLYESVTNTSSGIIYHYDYVPPPLELYTQFSLQTHFFTFWGLLLLRLFTIIIIDKIWVKNVPQSATLWNRIIHAVQKSSFPFPYSNWHQENGSCSDHLKRKEAAQHEVLVSIMINLIFNMILLVPLPIFCKI